MSKTLSCDTIKITPDVRTPPETTRQFHTPRDTDAQAQTCTA
ncbi:hypothetical protein IMCC12053_2562 [Celeribacter marinus]|uniref:Uncharacterized protein n=1 Tax=Celeribacter marinus TaxID=1397108 RepID=A0A0N7HIY4_9RHOB|nr:hypothetical protein IMCC12053_2562 [Celeribacter marinus]